MKKSIVLAISLFLGISYIFAQNKFEGTWSGKLSVGPNSLTLVFNISSDAKGIPSCSVDSPDQGAKGIPATIEIPTDSSLVISIPVIGASYKGILHENRLQGTFSQSGMSFPVTLQKGETSLNRPQNPTQPYPYKTEEVTFTNERDGATLAGTLSYPIGYDNQNSTKVPVVIMVTGSGQQDRNEEVFDHKPFLVIADYFARNGIATLRFDDRGYGKSHGGDVKNATTENFMHDAYAGVEYLKKSGKFGKIGILGHSEGGSIAFMLGARKAVDFVISLAGIGVKADEALTAQKNKMMELNGQTGNITVEMYRENALSQDMPWLHWFIDYDPTKDITNTSVPVMAINGDKDCQVIASLNLAAIKEKLPANNSNIIKEYPSLNHLFQHCSTGNPLEYRAIEETISKEVLNDMATWINGLK